MKVLWVGDAVVSTGFALCTHAACDHLHRCGHDVTVLGINYHGNPHPYPYPIYPCIDPPNGHHDPLGISRLPAMVRRLHPDIVVFLTDPWHVPTYIGYLRARLDITQTPLPLLAAWLAVDGENVDGTECNGLDHIVVWTDFAKQELVRGGCTAPISIAPLGVDTGIFHPTPRPCPSRLHEKVPPGAFVVGTVGRNQHRKRLDLTVEYFASWCHDQSVDDAYLVVHSAPTMEDAFNIHALSHYHGISNRVITTRVEPCYGMTVEQMRTLYSHFDVYLTTTQGEGWGLPTLEAMACGVPCVVPDWSGLGSWAGDAAYLIPCTSIATQRAYNRPERVIGGIMDKRLTIDALDSLYRSPDLRARCTNAGLELARELSWEWSAAMVEEQLIKLYQSGRQAPVPIVNTAP